MTWRFIQQKNEAGEKLNLYHIEEKDAVIGVFVYMNTMHGEAGELDERMEFYTGEEMDDEYELGWQTGWREGAPEGSPSPASPPAPPEAPTPALSVVESPA